MTEHDASQPDGVPFIEDALSEKEAVESCQAFDEEFGPVFLDDEGPSDDLPICVLTQTARDLFGVREGETVAEAAARKAREDQAGQD